MKKLLGAGVQAFAIGFAIVVGVVAFACVVAAFVLFILTWLIP